MERRTFLVRIVQFFSGLIAVLFALPVFSFIRASFISGGFESTYPIGNIDALPVDEVTRVVFTRLLRDGWMVRTVEEHVWVRKKSDGTVLVFEPHCTHLGCAYDWDAKTQQFLCPCHGGKFDKDGTRVAGPPPRPLDRFETRIENNQIRIGKFLKA
jgi:menaquinol-cytochrome c reductase iron-sulfur subunit